VRCRVLCANLSSPASPTAYLYFLVIAVLVFIPIISPVKPYGPVAALAFLVLVSAVREGIEDWKRHMEDRTVNNAVCRVMRGAKGESEAVPWHEVVVGDVVKIEGGELLPADVVLLASSDPKGLAFVSTVGLDGETNAKLKRVCDPENGRCEGVDRTGSVRSEAPNRDLSAFTGTLTWDRCEGKTVSLDNQSIFYRGSRLVTTSCIIGVVVFTGRDTKIMQNFEGAATRFKVTSLDRRIDRYILIVFAILFALCLGSALSNGILYENVARTLVYLQPWSDSPAVSGVINFFTFFILYSGIVPLAMYVSMELVKVVHAVLINWDLDLCLDQQGSRAKSALSAELGCVQHLFSDKTGTLTRNEMVLRHLCGRDGVAKSPAVAVMEEEALCLALVLCHTVQTGASKGERLMYDAESPDEKALVTGLAEAGAKSFVFAGREVASDGRSQFVSLLNGVRFELLATLEFSSDRKMMSVIVRAPDGSIVVYCKGAEQVVFERLSRGAAEQVAVEAAGKCLESFTLQGLRTLAVASRRVTEAEYAAWAVRYRDASVCMERRTERVRAACDEMECDFTLLGVTAVEDRLQDAVPETIAALLGAGIKVWMITGDHRDTAINIARACHLVSGSLTKLADAGDEAEAVALLAAASTVRDGVIVIDGKTLEHVLGSVALREQFVHVCDSARSIVCCRVSPKQKGQIVALMRSSRHVVTMAVG
jgi:phospholipid-transporting ATPase